MTSPVEDAIDDYGNPNLDRSMTKQDEIFNHLCSIVDVLEKEDIKYRIAEGTLLGAVREKDIISHETKDFELDVTTDQVPAILKLNKKLKTAGYEFVDRAPGVFSYDMGYHICDMKAPKEPVGGAGLNIKYNGKVIGDISVYQVFNDGFARRYCLASEAFPLPRATLPAWFLEGNNKVELRGRKFSAPREPEMLLRKMFGPEWKTPKKPKEFPKGFHPRSGHCYQAEISPLITHALLNGWVKGLRGKPAWPRNVKFVGSHVGRTWMITNDPFMGVYDQHLFSAEERDRFIALFKDKLDNSQMSGLVTLVYKRSSERLHAADSEKMEYNDKIQGLDREKERLFKYFEDFQTELDTVRDREENLLSRRSVRYAITSADMARNALNRVKQLF